MDNNMILWSIIPGGFSGAVVVYILREWISRRLRYSIKLEYDRTLADHKSQLKRDNDVYLAELNAKHDKSKQLLEHNLELARLEHKTKFAGSYQEILKAIKDIHAKLINVQIALNAYTNIFESSEGPSKEERRKQVGELVREFWEIFNPERIFLAMALDEKIVQYIHDVTDKSIDFMLNVEEQTISAETREEWIRINDEVKKESDIILSSIRSQFRAILGIESEKFQNTNVEDFS